MKTVVCPMKVIGVSGDALAQETNSLIKTLSYVEIIEIVMNVVPGNAITNKNAGIAWPVYKKLTTAKDDKPDTADNQFVVFEDAEFLLVKEMLETYASWVFSWNTKVINDLFIEFIKPTVSVDGSDTEL